MRHDLPFAPESLWDTFPVSDRHPGRRVLAQGFARARCSSCGYDSLAAFSWEGRGACPTAPRTGSFGAVSFLNRFGSSLNPQFIELTFASFDGLVETLSEALPALCHGPLGSISTSA